jgi:hypothetical protein
VRFSYVAETKAFVKSVALFLLVVVGGTAVFMIASSFIGYLPYSDRPGPGWYGWFPVRSAAALVRVVWFMVSFALLCLPAAAVYGSLLVLVIRGIEYFRPRRLFVAVASAIAASFVSILVIAGVGWLIALGRVTVYVAGILGLAYGAFLLPKRTDIVSAPAR